MPPSSRNLEQLLQETVDTLFPAGNAPTPLSVRMADSEGDTPLHVYLWRNDGWAVKTLLDAGADPNAVGDMGETPLHVAARKASAETLAALVAAGAREGAVSEFGQTPAQLAEEMGRASVFREAVKMARRLQRP